MNENQKNMHLNSPLNINSVTRSSSPVSIKQAARPFNWTTPSASTWPSFFKTRERFFSSSRNFWSCTLKFKKQKSKNQYIKEVLFKTRSKFDEHDQSFCACFWLLHINLLQFDCTKLCNGKTCFFFRLCVCEWSYRELELNSKNLTALTNKTFFPKPKQLRNESNKEIFKR